MVKKKKTVKKAASKKVTSPTNFREASAEVIRRLQEKFGVESTLRLSDGTARSSVTEVIPTGIDVLDHHVLGCGGLPVKRMIELFAEEGKGKTSLLYAWYAAVQRAGGIGIMSVTEEVDEERAALFGVDLDKMIILQPEFIEEVGAQAKDAIEHCTEMGLGPILYGWDSLAATPTKREIEEGLDGNARVGDRAVALSRLGRLFGGVLHHNRVSMVIVNQVRQNIGVMFGDKYTTPGGMAIKFLASIRLALLGGKKEDDDEGEVGAVTPIIRAAKNKVARPYRSARLKLDFAKGWDNTWSTVEYGMEAKLVGPGSHRSKTAYQQVIEKAGWVRTDSGLYVPDAEEYEDEDEPSID